jgi:hypothetical protein
MSKTKLVVFAVAIINVIFWVLIFTFRDKFPKNTTTDNQPQNVEDQSTSLPVETSPQVVVETILTHIKNGNKDAVGRLMSGRATLDPDVFNAYYGKNFTHRVLNVRIETPRTLSYVDLEITLEGKKTRHSFVLLRENNTWALVSYSIQNPVTYPQNP